jgi:hypothetical protein
MNTNLLDLNNDILNFIGDYVKKDNHDIILKQDILEYVNINENRKKKAREGKYYISRADTRYTIRVYFVEFCSNRFGFDYMDDKDKYGEIIKLYCEYLTIKN